MRKKHLVKSEGHNNHPNTVHEKNEMIQFIFVGAILIHPQPAFACSKSTTEIEKGVQNV